MEQTAEIQQRAEKLLSNNNRFQSKLSWKRKEGYNLRNQIKSFILDNFDITLPGNRIDYKTMKKEQSQYNEAFVYMVEECEELIKLYYTLGEYGMSIGSLFTQDDKFETYTEAHFYSKHKIDPVWNWRKSQLIRTKYLNFISKYELWEKPYLPVHITLTLPHAGGYYENKRFYAKELIERFNVVRKYPQWKKFVYGGEYGVEVKKTKNIENGLHIHIHSFSLLNENVRINEFRKWLSEIWQRLTGAVMIGVETIYIHKKDENNKFLTESKVKGSKTEISFEDNFNTGFENFREEKKKFYIDKEISRIQKSNIPEAFKKEEIKNCYLQGIMETIKYHFKMDDLMQINSETLYDIDLINDILINTNGKRMYSRFGEFYQEQELNFNNLTQNETESDDEEINSKAQQEIVNPFTKKFVFTEDTTKVAFYPEKQKRQPKTAPNPFSLINSQDGTLYRELGKGISIGQSIKTALRSKSKQKKRGLVNKQN